MESIPDKRTCLGLLRRRMVWLPTARGWLMLVLAVLMGGGLFLLGAYPFFSANDRRAASVLVVEGWAPVFAMEHAIEEWRTNRYERVYVTGGPLEQGSVLLEYETYAQLGAAILVKLGMDSNAVVSVPATWVRQDRTYHSAVTLDRWFREHGRKPAVINLLSDGPHSRRSRLLFSRALGKDVEIGVIAVPPRDYDPRRWWRSSHGFRSVLGEALAYVYARLLFDPETS